MTRTRLNVYGSRKELTPLAKLLILQPRTYSGRSFQLWAKLSKALYYQIYSYLLIPLLFCQAFLFPLSLNKKPAIFFQDEAGYKTKIFPTPSLVPPD